MGSMEEFDYNELKVLNLLEIKHPLDPKELAFILDMSLRDVKKTLKKLKKRGAVTSQKAHRTNVYEKNWESPLFSRSAIIENLSQFDYRERYEILVLVACRKYGVANPNMVQKEVKYPIEVHMIRSALKTLGDRGMVEIIRPLPLSWKSNEKGFIHLRNYENRMMGKPQEPIPDDDCGEVEVEWG